MWKSYLIRGTENNQGALNFSDLLEAPAGKHGFLRSRDGHLFFDDGLRARFVGVSMVGAGCLPDHETAEIIAARLASNGVNLVRMHYMDGAMHDKDSIRLIDYTSGSSRKLNPAGLERLDFFFAQLKERGIYVQLDTFVGRNWMPEGDELDYLDEIPKNWAPKQANIFNRRMIELQKEYQSNLLTHTNAYTGLRYADDPAMAVVQIMNENSLLWDFSASFNLETLPLHYRMELREKWRLFLKDKYKTNEALIDAWTDEHGVCALMAVEHVDYMVQLPPAPHVTGDIVGAEHTWPQTGLDSQTRTSDFLQFLIGIEEAYYREMNEHLRGMGIRCAINGTNLIRGYANVYTSSRGGDVQEQDSYYNHPYLGYSPPAKVTQQPMSSADPRIKLFGMATDCRFLPNDATAAAEGRPLIIAEWNAVSPTPFDADAMLEMTAYSAFQDWDGMCCFMYTGRPDKAGLEYEHMDYYFSIYNDPSKWGQIGISSYVFQKQCVQPAKHCIYLCCTQDDLLANGQPSSMVPYATLPFISKVAVKFADDDRFTTGEKDVAITCGYTPTGDLTGAAHAVVFSDSPYADLHHKKEGRKAFLARHAEENSRPFYGMGRIGEKRLVIEDGMKFSHDPFAYGDAVSEAMRCWGLLKDDQGIVHGKWFCADTGELSICPEECKLHIDTQGFAAFAGAPDPELNLGGMQLRIRNEMIAVSVLPRDDKPIADSRYLLLTAIGKTTNTDVRFENEWLLDLGHAPVLIDQAEGQVTLPGVHEGLTVYALQPNGERRETLPVRYDDAGATFELLTDEGTIHYELRREEHKA